MIIGDSSAIITLAIVNKLELLEKLYNNFYVPQAVYDEVTKVDKPYNDRLKNFLKTKVKRVNLKLNKSSLGLGELEAIALYKELNANVLLIDDNHAKKFAISNNIKVIGSLGILIKAKEANLIKEIKPLLDTIQKSKIFISTELINQVLKICNE